MILFLFLSLTLCLFIFYIVFKPSRHKINIRKAQRVLLTIRAINGHYKEAKTFTYLRKISPYVFEELLLTVFQEHGFTISRNKRYSHDGGLDGQVYDNFGNLYLVQAKRYKGYINSKHLTDFQKCIYRKHAKGGYFIHTGKTGKDHLLNYRQSNIEILSGNRLLQFIELPSGK